MENFAKTNPFTFKDCYVGSLSLTTMYVEAFANWVVGKQGEVVWDIYSYNYTAAAEKLIDALNCPWIRLCPPFVIGILN